MADSSSGSGAGICVVHNYWRQAAECYLNLEGHWECKTSCPAFQVVSRIGNNEQPAVPLERLSPLSSSKMLLDYQKAVETQQAKHPGEDRVNPVELCATHRCWRAVNNLELTSYSDYCCLPHRKCLIPRLEWQCIQRQDLHSQAVESRGPVVPGRAKAVAHGPLVPGSTRAVTPPVDRVQERKRSRQVSPRRGPRSPKLLDPPGDSTRGSKRPQKERKVKGKRLGLAQPKPDRNRPPGSTGAENYGLEDSGLGGTASPSSKDR